VDWKNCFSVKILKLLYRSAVIGVCKLILTQHAIPYSEYTPMQIKQSITGYGRSSKEQLSTMLRKILNAIQYIIMMMHLMQLQ
jgi:crossover junction endodeoxyribonuclease RuvC